MLTARAGALLSILGQLRRAIFSLQNGRIIAEASGENLQKAFGADVISRIRTGERGRAVRLNAVRSRDGISRSFRKEATSIRRVAIAGNTTMEYLLLGRDAACIPQK